MNNLPPKEPRFKKAKAGSGKQQQLVQKKLSDTARLSDAVPDDIKLAVATAIMQFSEMEMHAEEFIWAVLGLSYDDGKLVTQIETKEKIELAKKLSERYAMPLHPNAQTTADAWTGIRRAIEARNKMAHGVWRMIDGAIPIVISHRIPTEPGSINSEHFPLDRIQSVGSICTKAGRLFVALNRKIATNGRPAPLPTHAPDDAELSINDTKAP
ncbi:hypothetical protein [Rhizobium mayense]|uniref:RiboL-PSP-HEPN domain-containing protein n=1 Tax=Rhizobium mayense TaxID=1312184 RepID=A0ABT7JSW5_9HYPH|nr:hypothetical protein [Rhizobium mayense]MDL2399449.1 hypothetical protein [Rhizobium mayense]